MTIRDRSMPHRFPKEAMDFDHLIAWKCAACGEIVSESGERTDCTIDWRAGSSLPDPDASPEWRTEWAVEITWAERVLDRVKRPSTQLGPFQTYAQVEQFIETYLRDRDVIAYRVLERHAAYTEWTGPEGPTEITDEAREAAMQRLFEEMNTR